MKLYTILSLAAITCWLAAPSHTCIAQAAISQREHSGPPTANTTPLAFTTQVKKSVVFLQTYCMHVPTQIELDLMPPERRLTYLPERVSKLSDEDALKQLQDISSGTGFLAYVPDGRLGDDQGFVYLITNRHVAQPGIESGHPCRVTQYVISMNRKGERESDPHYAQTFTSPPQSFSFPEDTSVDLAASMITLDPTAWDMKTVPVSMFGNKELTVQGRIVEGDPVFFAGLFIQLGVQRLEPIIRSGSLAMIPTDPILTTLNLPGYVYLAEAHAFGGNSGSPMFIEINKFTHITGQDYRLLGIVSGEFFENTDLTLQATTSKSIVHANSDVSMIVPAEEISKLLYSPTAQRGRDLAVKKFTR